MKLVLNLDESKLLKLIAHEYAELLYERNRSPMGHSKATIDLIEKRALEVMKEMPEVDEGIRNLLSDEGFRETAVEHLIRERAKEYLRGKCL